MVDGTYIQAHPSSTGARKQDRTPAPSRKAQAIGHRRGGLTTQLWALGDKHGRCVRFLLWPGHTAEVTAFAEILDGVPTEETRMLRADKGCDSNPGPGAAGGLGPYRRDPAPCPPQGPGHDPL